MIPIPQYPIYSASIDLFGGKKVGYYLDESKGWDMNLQELERSLADAKAKGRDLVFRATTGASADEIQRLIAENADPNTHGAQGQALKRTVTMRTLPMHRIPHWFGNGVI